MRVVLASVAALLLSISSCAPAAEQKESANGGTNVQAESQLLGVRFIGPADTLSHVERAAAKVGWTDVQRDREGSILVLSPKPYRFEDFTKLVDAMDEVPKRDFSLQLIGPDGQPVNLGPADEGS